MDEDNVKATTNCQHSIQDLLRMLPAVGAGEGLGIRALAIDMDMPGTAPPKPNEKVHPISPGKTSGRQLAIGLVTECVPGIDVDLLRLKRSDLKQIEGQTGAQIREKAGLRGHNLMVTGTRVVVEEAMHLIESTLFLSHDAEREFDDMSTDQSTTASSLRSLQVEVSQQLPSHILNADSNHFLAEDSSSAAKEDAEQLTSAYALQSQSTAPQSAVGPVLAYLQTLTTTADLGATCVTPPPGLEAMCPPLSPTSSDPLGSDIRDTGVAVGVTMAESMEMPMGPEVASDIRDTGVAVGVTMAESMEMPMGPEVGPESTKKKSKKNKAERKRAQQESPQANGMPVVDPLDEIALSMQRSNISSEGRRFSFPRPRVLEGVKSRKKAILQMSSVSFTYPDKKKATIVNASLAICQASRIIISGAKGAGKSTILDVLVGLQTPSSGQTQRVEGLRIAYVGAAAFQELEEHAGELPASYIKQKFAGLKPDRIRDTEEQPVNLLVEQHLEAFGAAPETLNDECVGQLSRSMKFRVAIAAAMCQSPQILVLDDPVSFLGYNDVVALTQGLEDFGGGVLVTSHSKEQEAFSTFATEKYVLRGGRLQADGVFEKAAAPVVNALETPHRNLTRGSCKYQIKEEIKRVETMMKDGADPLEVSMLLNSLKERLKSS